MLTSRELNEKHSYATEEEIEWVQQWARNQLSRTQTDVVMIGAGPGIFALALLETHIAMNLTVVEVSTFQPMTVHLKSAGIGVNQVQRILKDSWEVGRVWTGPLLDLLIVDGDHSKEGVLRDIEAWCQHVRLGGLVLFHDYRYNLQREPTGVKEAVDTLPDSWIHFLDIGISRIMQKSI